MSRKGASSHKQNHQNKTLNINQKIKKRVWRNCNLLMINIKLILNKKGIQRILDFLRTKKKNKRCGDGGRN